MKFFSMKYRFFSFTFLIILFSGVLISCVKKTTFIPKSDLLSLPSLSAKNFKTVYTDSGKVQLILSSSLMEEYDNKDIPYTEFKTGIKVLLFQGEKDTVGQVTSKYARYTKNDNLWELKDSVVVINNKNDKLETELLYWDQNRDLIYTDRFVKITNKDQIMQGYGFESDTHLQHRKIKKVSAIIYLPDAE
jgi:LPS export ABC transporter protein LptC